MEIFKFTKAADVPQAIQAGAASSTAQQGAQVRFIAGGTTLLDLMKLNVERPTQVVDINRLPLDKVERLPDGRLKIGALVRNSDLALQRGRKARLRGVVAGPAGRSLGAAAQHGDHRRQPVAANPLHVLPQ